LKFKKIHIRPEKKILILGFINEVFYFPKYQLTAFSNPIFISNSGEYWINLFAFFMLANVCRISPPLFGPYEISIASILGSFFDNVIFNISTNYLRMVLSSRATLNTSEIVFSEL